MPFELINTGEASAQSNMEFDRHLLKALDPKSGICQLHLYRWQGPSATYGHFCKPATLLQAEGIKRYRLQLAQRPTGGGVTFHDYDYAFSLLLSASHSCFCHNILESYRLIHEIILQVIARFQSKPAALLSLDEPASYESCRHFCMAKPTIYDLSIDGQKVAGGAQRRTKEGILHQGMISLTLPPVEFLNAVLPADGYIAEAMAHHSYPLLKNEASKSHLDEVRSLLDCLLVEVCQERLA